MDNSIEEYFDKISHSYDYYKSKNKYLKLLIKSLIVNPDKKSILDCGCGTGEVLDYLMPLKGVGLDVSSKMINLAAKKYTNKQNLIFKRRDIEQDRIDIDVGYDYVLLIDILEHLNNPPLVLGNIKKAMQQETKLIIITANKKWSFLLLLFEKLKLKMPEGSVRWLSSREIISML